MKLRPYSKKQLAVAYSPELSTSAALRRLRHWLDCDRPLLAALQQTGYHKSQRIFTSKQVALIFEYIGEP